MKILGIDTSSAVLSLGLTDDDKVIGEWIQNKALTHSKDLMPRVSYLLESLEVNIKEIDLFCVTIGPGSFTGIRIGVATANAFSMATGKPVVGISTLEALAYNFPYPGMCIITTLSAQGDNYYRGIYQFDSQGEELIVLSDVETLSQEEVLVEATELTQQGEVLIVGEITNKLGKTTKCQDSIFLGNKLIRIARVVDNYIRGGVLCQIARRLQDGSLGYAAPVYIRKPQAEVQYEERMKRGKE